jgi:hypothetical protein
LIKQNKLPVENVKLVKKLNLINKIIKNRGEENLSPETLNAWEEVYPIYLQLLSEAKDALESPASSNFLELIPLTNSPDDMSKTAHNALTRYLKRKWLKHKPNFLKDEDVDSRKISCIDNILEALKSVDLLMNVMEIQGVQPNYVFENFSKLSIDLSQVFEDLAILADLHNSMFDITSKSDKKNYTLAPIRKTDIAEMKKFAIEMRTFGDKSLVETK